MLPLYDQKISPCFQAVGVDELSDLPEILTDSELTLSPLYNALLSKVKLDSHHFCQTPDASAEFITIAAVASKQRLYFEQPIAGCNPQSALLCVALPDSVLDDDVLIEFVLTSENGTCTKEFIVQRSLLENCVDKRIVPFKLDTLLPDTMSSLWTCTLLINEDTMNSFVFAMQRKDSSRVQQRLLASMQNFIREHAADDDVIVKREALAVPKPQIKRVTARSLSLRTNFEQEYATLGSAWLPEELWCRIFAELSFSDLMAIRRVCQCFRSIAFDNVTEVTNNSAKASKNYIFYLLRLAPRVHTLKLADPKVGVLKRILQKMYEPMLQRIVHFELKIFSKVNNRSITDLIKKMPTLQSFTFSNYTDSDVNLSLVEKMISLQHLSLRAPALSKNIIIFTDLSHLTSLRTLHLENFKDMPHSWNSIVGLEHLSFGHREEIDKIRECFQGNDLCVRTDYYGAHYYHLFQFNSVAPFLSLSSLKRLDLVNNRCPADILDLARLEKLEELHFFAYDTSVITLLEHAIDFPALHSLGLSVVHIPEERLIEALLTLSPRIRSLNIRSVRLSARLLSTLSTLAHLEELFLPECDCSAIHPFQIDKFLAQMPSLKRLALLPRIWNRFLGDEFMKEMCKKHNKRIAFHCWNY